MDGPAMNPLPFSELRGAYLRTASVNWLGRSGQLHFEAENGERVGVLLEGLQELKVVRRDAESLRVDQIHADATDGWIAVRIVAEDGDEVTARSDSVGWQDLTPRPRRQHAGLLRRFLAAR